MNTLSWCFSQFEMSTRWQNKASSILLLLQKLGESLIPTWNFLASPKEDFFTCALNIIYLEDHERAFGIESSGFFSYFKKQNESGFIFNHTFIAFFSPPNTTPHQITSYISIFTLQTS